MTKQELLKTLHEIAWRDDDLMEQETLFELQELIEAEIYAEAFPDQGEPTMRVIQLPNGYLKHITII